MPKMPAAKKLPPPKELIKREIFAVYKPKGWTSFRVVQVLRKLLKIKKIGYLGTLDPMAEGVLVVGVQKGTKKLKFLPQEKEYIAEIAFGIETETWDLEGNIKIKNKKPLLKPVSLREKINEFQGEITQIIPAFSAKWIKGKRLYQIARSGKKIKPKDLPRKKVQIKKIKILNLKEKRLKIKNKEISLKVAKLKIKCSKGTFIRSLAFEIGQKIGTPATLIKLLRTKDGGFSLKDCFALKD